MPRVNPSVNRRPWAIMRCQRQLPDCDPCASLLQVVHSGGGCECVERGGGYQEYPTIFTQFCCKPKTVPKKKKNLLKGFFVCVPQCLFFGSLEQLARHVKRTHNSQARTDHDRLFADSHGDPSVLGRTPFGNAIQPLLSSSNGVQLFTLEPEFRDSC